MYFIIYSERKIIFGWSAKCGCTHFKGIVWNLLYDEELKGARVHEKKARDKLPSDIENYISVLVIRNPYERLVSGFLDKYKPRGQYRNIWKCEPLTFTKFVDELIKPNWKVIEQHHFTPQITEDFNADKLLKSKGLKTFDIVDIDYNFLEKLYNKKISDFSIKQKHQNYRKATVEIKQPIYDLNIDDFFDNYVPTQFFYSEDIKNKVYNFYIDDFTFFKNNGFDYI